MCKDTWYKDGLNFSCIKCSKCCFGFSGVVWIFEKDIEKISKFLKISKTSFLEKYTTKIDNNISLKEVEKEKYRCIFLKDFKKCSIYPVRPFQCRSFPFWPQNLASKKDWESLKKTCKGIDKPPTKYSFKDIEKTLQKHKKIHKKIFY